MLRNHADRAIARQIVASAAVLIAAVVLFNVVSQTLSAADALSLKIQTIEVSK